MIHLQVSGYVILLWHFVKILWKNTLHNSRYISPLTTPRNYSMSTNHQPLAPPPALLQHQNYQIPVARVTQSRSVHYQPPNNLYTSSRHPNNQYQSYTNNQSNNEDINRQVTYSTNGQNNRPPTSTQKRRVKIIDQTTSTSTNDYASGSNGYSSKNVRSNFDHPKPDINKTQPKSKSSVLNQQPDHVEENRFGYDGGHFNLHEYLYGLAEPNPG